MLVHVFIGVLFDDDAGENRYVFNIKGNDFRLIVSLSFQSGLGYVQWFGTHAEYDVTVNSRHPLEEGINYSEKNGFRAIA